MLLAPDALGREAHLKPLSHSLIACNIYVLVVQCVGPDLILMYRYKLRPGSEKWCFGAGSKKAQYVITGSNSQKLSCKR